MDTYFAVTAPGTETLTILELTRLGLLSEAGLAVKETGNLPAASLQPSTVDALHFQGGLPALYRANLHLRTASRILVRLGMPFLARTFPELLEKASRLPWERFLTPGQPVTLRVTCHKSKLYHSEAVAERLLTSLEARLGKASPRLKPAEDDASAPAQLILARIVDDKCTVSLDSSGELLHRRGYRLAAAKAPLRETLAAALLLASGWDGSTALIDPFCGSGTLPIEAALLARQVPAGLNRRFAFMDWPGFDEALWNEIRSDVQPSPLNMPPILASDRDAGAIKIAQENAQRAGVADWIQFTCQAVSHLAAPATAAGFFVTNPPYGLRVSPGKDLRNLYAQFGNVLRARFPGWQVAILSSDMLLLGQTGMKLETVLSFNNGGLPVRLVCGRVPALPG